MIACQAGRYQFLLARCACGHATSAMTQPALLAGVEAHEDAVHQHLTACTCCGGVLPASCSFAQTGPLGPSCLPCTAHPEPCNARIGIDLTTGVSVL